MDKTKKIKNANDSPEDIKKCLSCERGSCCNCLAYPKSSIPKRKTPVEQLDGDKVVAIYESQKEASLKTGISQSLICNAIAYNKPTHGFYWRRAVNHG